MKEGQSSSQGKSSQAAAAITTLGMTKAQSAEGERAMRNVIMRICGAAGWLCRSNNQGRGTGRNLSVVSCELGACWLQTIARWRGEMGSNEWDVGMCGIDAGWLLVRCAQRPELDGGRSSR